MGLTQKLGTIPLAIQTDSSNNVGIGGAANASYKLAVTGASLFSSSILANSVMSLGDDGTYGATYKTLGLTGNTNGTHRILAGTSDDMYLAAATGRGIYFWTDGSSATRMRILANGNVGIGTSSPTNPLHIVSNTVSQLNVAALSGNTNAQINLEPTGTGVALIGPASAFPLAFRTDATERMRITSGGIIYALNSGVDGSYQPMIGGMYSSNNNETNLISTAVSSVASQSGFRFDVSNGAGSTGRTTSMTINRSSVTIVGSLSKGSGSFKIDHPIESMSETHHLVHSFVESPQANNIYRGKVQLVNGKAEVNLDEVSTMTEGTFVLLNREIHTYTSNETDWDAVRGKVDGNILTIECQNNQSNAMVSWLIIGERQDKHMMDTEWTDDNGKVIVEPLKVTALENK